jgi:hypothetical protein
VVNIGDPLGIQNQTIQFGKRQVPTRPKSSMGLAFHKNSKRGVGISTNQKTTTTIRSLYSTVTDSTNLVPKLRPTTSL